MNRSRLLCVLLPTIGLGLVLSGCSRRRDVTVYEQVSPGHVCSRNCLDHHYVDDRVIFIDGHRHSRHCGHYWDGRHWRMNRAARLNPRPYRSAPIRLRDRHGQYHRPKPRYRDRDEYRRNRRNRNDRRIRNTRRDRDDRHRDNRSMINRNDRRDIQRDRRDERRVLQSRRQPIEKNQSNMRQKRSSNRD